MTAHKTIAVTSYLTVIAIAIQHLVRIIIIISNT